MSIYSKTTISSRGAIVASYNAAAGTGRWLEYGGNPSNEVPYVQPEPGVLRAISLSVANSTTVTASILKNGVSVATISLTSSLTGVNSNISIPVAVGDTLSIQITSGSCNKPSLFLFIQM